VLGFVLFVVWVALAGASLLWGLDYYLLPVPERAFSPLADQFAPTGFIGHGYGIVGTMLVVIGVIGYAARKRMTSLTKLGSLSAWLQVHIFLCTLGPFLVLLHTSFKFGGIVAISFWSMAVVVASGVFGRYVYVRIPKAVNGRFLEAAAVRARTDELAREIEARTGISGGRLSEILSPRSGSVARPGLLRSLVMAVTADLSRRRRIGALRRALRTEGVSDHLHQGILTLAGEEARLHQQALLLHPFQRLFRYWHVLHLPLAAVMFIILGVHVAVAILFGYTWVF